MFDADERAVFGPVNATPLFQLFDENGYDPGIFADCARRCIAQTGKRSAVLVFHVQGVAVVGASLTLEGRIVGAAVGGYALVDFSQVSEMQRLAQQSGIAAQRLWEVARKQVPVPRGRLIVQGELLQVLGDSLLRENFRARQYEHTAAMQRESEARYRELVEQVKDYAIFRIDLEGRAVTWNEGVQRLLGFTENEFIDRDITESIFTPEDIQAGVPQRELADAARSGVANNDRWMRRKIGERFFALGTTSAIKDERGSLTGFTKVMRDHTKLKEAEDALRASEEQFRRAVEDAPIPVIMHANDGEVLQISKMWTELTGYRLEDIPTFDAFTNAYGFGAEAVRQRVKELFAGATGIVQAEFDILTRRGEKRAWVFSASSPGTLRDGRRFVVGMAVDITERKRADEHTKLLLREVSHRAKNLLAVAQSVARLTAGKDDPKAFAERFSARLAGLAASLELLVQNDWHGVDVGDLVRAQLSHFRDLIGSRIALDGPAIQISPAAAQTLGMAILELATNAGKYGALSNNHGSVRVSWGVSANGGSPRYHMSWRERDGPPVARPERQGFGHTVTVQMVEHGLDGVVAVDHASDGLDWQMSAPSVAVVESATAPSASRG